MKKIFFSILILAVATKVQTSMAQEKLKEGKMTYEISYPESESMSDQMLAMMPKDMTTWFKNGQSRTEIKMAMGSTVILYDPKTKENIICSDMMGRKNAIKSTAEEADKEKEKSFGEYEVKITDETKKIAGYKAKKAIVTFKSDHDPAEVWFTDEIAAESSGRTAWKGIDGFPLEYTSEQKTQMGNLKMKMTCTKIEKTAVSDDLFKVPEGYKLTTREEMMKQFQDKKMDDKDKKPDAAKKDTLNK